MPTERVMFEKVERRERKIIKRGCWGKQGKVSYLILFAQSAWCTLCIFQKNSGNVLFFYNKTDTLLLQLEVDMSSTHIMGSCVWQFTMASWQLFIIKFHVMRAIIKLDVTMASCVYFTYRATCVLLFTACKLTVICHKTRCNEWSTCRSCKETVNVL